MAGKNSTNSKKDVEDWLKSATLNDVVKLKERLDDVLARKEEEAQEAARQAIVAVAKEHGYTVDELFKKGKRGSKKSAGPVGKALYHDPENPKNAWTGKGPRPKWFKALLENGKTVDDLRIPEVKAAE